MDDRPKATRIRLLPFPDVARQQPLETSDGKTMLKIISSHSNTKIDKNIHLPEVKKEMM